MLAQLVEQLAFNQSVVGSTPTQPIHYMTLSEYFESRRKEIDRYVEGEHKWYGDLSTELPSLSMYEGNIPWYIKEGGRSRT